MIDNKLKDFFKTMREVMFFPELTMIFIPSLIFISLFFIPEGYSGITRFTQTLDGTYQNKWLFDTIYVGVIILLLHIHANAILNKNFSTNKYKFIKFLRPRIDEPNKKRNDINPKYLKIIFYLLFVFFLYMMNSDSIPFQNDGSSRKFVDFNRLVFVNYFICIFGIYGSIIFSGYTSFLTKEDMDKGQNTFRRM